MGGIAGSQTLTLMIRGMALGRVQDSNQRWLAKKRTLRSGTERNNLGCGGCSGDHAVFCELESRYHYCCGTGYQSSGSQHWQGSVSH